MAKKCEIKGNKEKSRESGGSGQGKQPWEVGINFINMEGLCPDSYYCEDGGHGYAAFNSKLLVVHDVGGVVSSVLSILGTTLILLAYTVPSRT